ncbi:MAG TPA: hypothetical protein PL193_05875 [Xanthobacteraceae bacterium]|nr:hypothetical protein [Xanthobacteraceae bacterium]
MLLLKDDPLLELRKLTEEGDHELLVEHSANYLRLPLTGLQKFEILQNVILHHRDHLAAMPLLDIVRQEMKDEAPYLRLILSFYEFRCRGRSILADTLPSVEATEYREGTTFLDAHPLDEEIGVASALLSGPLAIDSATAGKKVLDAVTRTIPLSLLRMGDGEGRFVQALDGLPATKRCADQIAKRIWFWNSDTPDNTYWEKLRDAYRSADIVGVHPPFRVNLEYRNSMQGYIGVVNGNRFLLDASSQTSSFNRTVNWLFSDLGVGFFAELFSIADRIYFVGAHPDIGDVLEQLGARHVKVIVTPSDNLVPNSISRPHYPDVFNEVISECRNAELGVWLVSCGSHAKIYCQEIKLAGGVALDIGSLSDRWMGLKTR